MDGGNVQVIAQLFEFFIGQHVIEIGLGFTLAILKFDKEVLLGQRRGAEGVGFDDIGPGFKKPGVDICNSIWFRYNK